MVSRATVGGGDSVRDCKNDVVNRYLLQYDSYSCKWSWLAIAAMKLAGSRAPHLACFFRHYNVQFGDAHFDSDVSQLGFLPRTLRGHGPPSMDQSRPVHAQ